MSDLRKAMGHPLEFTIGGQTYRFGALTLNDLVEMEAKGLSLDEGLSHSMATMRFMLWLSVRHHHKEMTEEQLGDLLDMDSMSRILAEIYPSDDEESKKKQHPDPSIGTR